MPTIAEIMREDGVKQQRKNVANLAQGPFFHTPGSDDKEFFAGERSALSRRGISAFLPAVSSLRNLNLSQIMGQYGAEQRPLSSAIMGLGRGDRLLSQNLSQQLFAGGGVLNQLDRFNRASMNPMFVNNMLGDLALKEMIYKNKRKNKKPKTPVGQLIGSIFPGPIGQIAGGIGKITD